VRRLRSGQDSFRAGELNCRREHIPLTDCHRFQQAGVVEPADNRGHAVVAQATRVNGVRDKVAAEGVHLEDWNDAEAVAVIKTIDAARERWGGCRFHCQKAGLFAVPQVSAQERQRDAAEIRAAAHAADDHIRVFAGQVHLLEGFLANNCLMQEHVVQHRTEPVFLFPVGFSRDFDRFGDGDAERTGVIGVLFQVAAPDFCVLGRAWENLRAVGLHDDAAVGLCQVGRVHHVHFHADAKHLAGHGQRGTPLPCARFGSQGFGAADFVEIHLRDGGIELVAAGG